MQPKAKLPRRNAVIARKKVLERKAIRRLPCVQADTVVSQDIIVVEEKNHPVILLFVVAKGDYDQPKSSTLGQRSFVDVSVAVGHFHHFSWGSKDSAYFCRCCLPWSKLLCAIRVKLMIFLVFAQK
ncbi:MAG: hypothetical protein BA861_10035 [Desulfobacterales bacterium S3730MH5]|nr:MAG: hypothetical protein BA861_10035 [Desulfobacterales bacterium S3730MH5]